MNAELEDFISNLDYEDPVAGNQQMNEIWKELEHYMDKAEFDIDEFLDDLLPAYKPSPTLPANVDIVYKSTNPLSTKEFIKSFGLSSNVLISQAEVGFKDKLFVPTELLLNSIRQEEHESRKTSLNLAENTPMGIHYVDNASNNNLNPLDKTSASMTLLGNEESSIDFNEINWDSVFANQVIEPGMTVNEFVENVMRDTSVKLSKKDIYDTVTLLFNVLNDYVDKFSAKFADYQFLDANELLTLSHKLQEDALSPSNIKANSLLQLLSKWMRAVTDQFIKINDHRRQIEEKVADILLDEAVNIYRERLHSHSSPVNLQRILSEGFLHAYSNCGSEFKNTKVAALEKRLTEVNAMTKKYDSQSAVQKEPTIPIELLVSEYAMSINQKGLQCASISTIEQFDDVKKNCLAEVDRYFQKRLDDSGASMHTRMRLRNELETKLEKVSLEKRSEYEQRMNRVSTVIQSSPHSKRTLAVGVHFGFEVLSVTYFDKSKPTFRSLYGPSPNLISFAPEGIFIGQIPPTKSKVTFDMQEKLKGPNLDAYHDTTYKGQHKLEAIIALILMQVDQITKLSLHEASQIKYAIAIPSCLNNVMQDAFFNAMQIAGMTGNLVREQCALTTHFLWESRRTVSKHGDNHIFTLIEDSLNSCDYVMYNLQQNATTKVAVSHIEGFTEKRSNWGFGPFMGPVSGFQLCLDNIKSIPGKQYRFIIYCSSTQKSYVKTKLIKDKFKESIVNLIPCDSSKITNGAAILCVTDEENVLPQLPFDLRQLVSVYVKGIHPIQKYRMQHQNRDRSQKVNQLHISTAMSPRNMMQDQFEKFATVKAKAKQFLLGKMKDVNESGLSGSEKNRQRRDLEKCLKAVEEELINSMSIQSLIDGFQI